MVNRPGHLLANYSNTRVMGMAPEVRVEVVSRSAVLAIVGLLALPFLTGCAVGRLDAVLSALAGDLSFASVQNARFSGDDGSSLADEMFRSIANERATGAKPGPWSFLALSGGQEDGAFGAGLLVGWSEHGSRPEFKIVTGASTGALAAPFAFLGSEYERARENLHDHGPADVVSASVPAVGGQQRSPDGQRSSRAIDRQVSRRPNSIASPKSTRRAGCS